MTAGKITRERKESAQAAENGVGQALRASPQLEAWAALWGRRCDPTGRLVGGALARRAGRLYTTTTPAKLAVIDGGVASLVNFRRKRTSYLKSCAVPVASRSARGQNAGSVFLETCGSVAEVPLGLREAAPCVRDAESDRGLRRRP